MSSASERLEKLCEMNGDEVVRQCLNWDMKEPKDIEMTDSDGTVYRAKMVSLTPDFQKGTLEVCHRHKKFLKTERVAK